MRTFQLRSGSETLKSISTYSETLAIEYFSQIKKLSSENLLKIYQVVEI